MTCAAAILAGGLSSRFGSPKCLARVGEESLLCRVARAVAQACDEVLVVAAYGEDPELDRAIATEISALGMAARIVRDTPGPKTISAGIEAALLYSTTGAVLVVGSDLPFLSPGLVAHMVASCRGHDAAVPFYRGFYEPACAVYTRRFLPAMSEYRANPQGPVSRLFDRDGLDVVRITEDEIRLFGDPDLLFLNVNTREDLARAEEVLRAQRGERG